MTRQDSKTFWVSLVVLTLLALFLSCARQEIPALPEERPVTPGVAPATTDPVEASAIRQALHSYLSRSGSSSTLDVDLSQISTASGYALVTWIHGEEGGQAVLHKEDGSWKVLDGGPGWMGLRGVRRQGVPDQVAKKLLDGLDPNWSEYETF